MKKILFLCLLASTAALFGQASPTIEIGAGMALKHTEGFYIPRFTVSGVNLYKGLGIYTTYEQRNNVNFVDDFNGDGNYQRYTIGPTLTLNQSLYAFGGVSPLGPYGLTHSFGKVRKEVGLGLIFNPITLRIGYSNWVGTTIGVHYRFGQTPNPVSFQAKRPRVKSAPSAAPEKITEVIRQVDTVVVTKEVIKEVPVEVIKEVERDEKLTLITKVYFRDNSIQYVPESFQRLQEIADAIKELGPGTVVIIGHTDARGNEAYNFNLGMERAQRFANDLVLKYGIPAASVEVRSLGKNEASSEEDSQNRRVEVFFKR
jgi:outer membrane protein OmpA-like peptidoglycan-associated protein